MGEPHAHPLFRRPWKELAPVVWGSYLVGPVVVVLLVIPFDRLNDLAEWRWTLVLSVAGVWLGLGLIHFGEAFVAPRLFNRGVSPARRGWVHAGIAATAILIAAEVMLRVFRPPEASPFAFRLLYYRYGVVDAGVLLIILTSLDRMKAQADALMREKELKAREARLAQLEALKVRTEPHFLFNALNTIACLIQIDAPKATRAVEQMSELFRFVLDSSQEALIPLSVELEIVRGYLEMESLRYQGMRYEMEIPPGVERTRVLPLLIQPIVENAVKHGISRGGSGGRIHIQARHAGERLLIRVENTVRELAPSVPNGARRSLGIIQQRLALAYGSAATFRHGPEGDGYCTCLEFPIATSLM
jgi:two-component system sensor histidine kinase AlgZ